MRWHQMEVGGRSSKTGASCHHCHEANPSKKRESGNKEEKLEALEEESLRSNLHRLSPDDP